MRSHMEDMSEMPCGVSFFCIGDEPKSGPARDLGDRLQSRNVPFGTSGDYPAGTVFPVRISERSCVLMRENTATKKLVMAGVLTALAVVGSLISFPIAGSKCAPVQHMVNILAAVTLGPGWGVGIAFTASLLRNILGIGSLLAFPGSMVGALCCGLVYAAWKKLAPTCVAEALGTGILGGLCAYPAAKLLMGMEPAGLFVYVVPFLVSTVAGSILAFILITVLEKGGVMGQLRAAN